MITKFRAWDKVINQMFIPDAIHFDSKGMVDGIGSKETIFGIEDFELMQSTDLRDKNGKEIFEGDVVLFDSKVYPVEFKNGIFGVNKLMIVNLYIGDMREYQEPLWNMVVDGCEVIGNIHEHPELLENI